VVLYEIIPIQLIINSSSKLLLRVASFRVSLLATHNNLIINMPPPG